MSTTPDRHARAMLPIPVRTAPGLTTYDAKDPDASHPRSSRCSHRQVPQEERLRIAMSRQ